MGIFQSFREPGWNTYYSDQLNFGSSVDLTMAVIIYLIVVMFAAMAMVVIGTRGNERWTTFLRLLVSFHTGVIIVVCLVGKYWQVSHVHSRSEYTPTIREDIVADVGIKIGLKSLNITLQSDRKSKLGIWAIKFNEEFYFNRLRDIKDSFQSGLERGLPRPILYSLEYFKVDGGGLRWTRALRNAGHFSYIILWSSLVAWLTSNILLCFVVVRGLVMLVVTGCLMVIASLIYHCMQPPTPLVIPFPDAFLRLYYGWCFWLCLCVGLLDVIIAVGLLVFYWKCPQKTNRVFLVDQTPPIEHEEIFDFSPGPLKIDTPFSRRVAKINRDNLGKLNNAFSLDECNFRPHSSCDGSLRASCVETPTYTSRPTTPFSGTFPPGEDPSMHATGCGTELGGINEPEVTTGRRQSSTFGCTSVTAAVIEHSVTTEMDVQSRTDNLSRADNHSRTDLHFRMDAYEDDEMDRDVENPVRDSRTDCSLIGVQISSLCGGSVLKLQTDSGSISSESVC